METEKQRHPWGMGPWGQRTGQHGPQPVCNLEGVRLHRMAAVTGAFVSTAESKFHPRIWGTLPQGERTRKPAEPPV